MKSMVVWFEIPVIDFSRARAFFSEIMQLDIDKQEMAGMTMGFFPMDANEYANSGSIVKGEGYIPSEEGTLIYLNAGDDMQDVLDRIEPAGGSVILPKTLLSEEIGYMAIFRDTEGNRLALFSRK